jgi:hypothetical protein
VALPGHHPRERCPNKAGTTQDENSHWLCDANG